MELCSIDKGTPVWKPVSNLCKVSQKDHVGMTLRRLGAGPPPPAGGARGVLEQQSEERPLRLPQQERAGQLQQQSGVSGSGFHSPLHGPVDPVVHGRGAAPASLESQSGPAPVASAVGGRRPAKYCTGGPGARRPPRPVVGAGRVPAHDARRGGVPPWLDRGALHAVMITES